jgi:hypothetical protein
MRLSRYFLLLATVWVIAMTWRIYPDFGDGLRIDGRVTSVEDYVNDSCTQRVGPAAQTCLAEAAGEAQILLRREQAKSVLMITAPILLYLLASLPKGLAGTAARRRNFPGAAVFALCAALWALAPLEAHAGGSQEQESEQKWHLADICTRTAFKKFPDYTPEGNTRRENYRRACMRDNGLPVPDGPAALQTN